MPIILSRMVDVPLMTGRRRPGRWSSDQAFDDEVLLAAIQSAIERAVAHSKIG
jgi:hypothetical protein